MKKIGWERCRSYAGENGFARVSIVDGDRVFRGSNKGGVLQGHYLKLDRNDLEYIKDFIIVHTNNNAFFDSQLPKLRGLGPLISYDFSIRWNEEDRIKRVCPYVDFAFLSCGDITEEETKRLCIKIYNEGCNVVTATRGSEGVIVYDGINYYHQAPDLVKAVDTMGAGDSFATCMLVGIAEAVDKDGIIKWNENSYKEKIFPKVLKEAAKFAAKTCLVDGAFGYGVEVPEALRKRLMEEAL
jgi:sugar/nucleoside kinase (ribokinase family)